MPAVIAKDSPNPLQSRVALRVDVYARSSSSSSASLEASIYALLIYS
ncbi:hypothetical protein HYFRA_00007139 [Hymenoscyphus fraxineus]|uniref:Uncharacterized protein n=1 Tax=Hymenoscyphus fraxineus TaxID=746836 RepID=A0A9N9KWF4_9HELO|nr:hypothetical protein HYFRA_00007139 [Hymenoscyphus fraxineus]